MVKIVSSIITKGKKNRPAYVNPKEFITIHNTGNTSKGAGAKNHANYLKNVDAEKSPISWHYTVDDTEIYQHLPENETGFHAGDGQGNGNRKSIGIEICMNSDGDLLKATDNAVELVADICKRNNISVSNIKQHYDWTKKDCPQMLRKGIPYEWGKFIENVKKLLSDTGTNGNTVGESELPREEEIYRVRAEWANSDSQEGAFKVFDNAKALADKLNKNQYFVYNSKGEVVYPNK